jgi:hypothetical protein
MKKIIIKSLILIFVLTTVFGLEISTTKAQLKECSQVSQGQCTQNGKTCTKYLPRGELAGQLGDIECPNDKGGVETTFGENVLQNGSGIGWTFINIGWGVLAGVVAMIFFIIFKFVSFLFMMSGFLLDNILDYTVVNFSTNIQGMTGINDAWKLIRDLINLSFIFILIYEGIQKIFGGGNAMKTITGIITAAILINFSLFFTKIIIDASNIVTVEFYNVIVKDGSTQQGGATQLNSFAATLTSRLNLSSFWEGYPASVTNRSSSDFANTSSAGLVTYAMGSVVTLIAMFTLLAISAMFLIRYVAYIFMLIISPIGVASSVVPGLKSYSDKYWGTLLNQSYWPPIYMLMTYIMLILISKPGFINISMNSGFSKSIAEMNGVSISGLILNYGVIIIFMIMTMTISKSFASKGGFVTSGMISTATGYLGGAMLGSAAFLGRTSVGRIADKVATSDRLKNWSKDSGLLGRGSKLLLKGADKTASSSLDLRESTLGKAIGSQLGVNVGKGLPWRSDAGKGGFVGRREASTKAKVEREEAFAEKLQYTPEQIKEANDKLKNADFRKEMEEKIEIERKRQQGTPEYATRKAKMDAELASAMPMRLDYEKKLAEGNVIKGKITGLTKDLKKLMEDLATARSSGASSTIITSIEANIQTKTNEIAKNKVDEQRIKDDANTLKKRYESALTLYYKLKAEQDAAINSYIPDEKKELLRIVGGQEEVKDDYGNITQEGIKGRVGEYLASRAGLYESGFIGSAFVKNKAVAKQLKKLSGKVKK